MPTVARVLVAVALVGILIPNAVWAQPCSKQEDEGKATPLQTVKQKGKEHDPWVTVGVYVGSGALVRGFFAGPWGGRLLRGSVPLAAAITAVRLLHGDASPRDLSMSASSYFVGGLVVTLLADGMVLPLLLTAGPMGWGGAALFEVAKFTAGTFLGYGIEQWLRKDPDGKKFSSTLFGEEKKGVKQKIDAIQP